LVGVFDNAGCEYCRKRAFIFPFPGSPSPGLIFAQTVFKEFHLLTINLLTGGRSKMISASNRKCGLLGGLCILSMCVAFNVSAKQNTMETLSPVIKGGRMATIDPDTGQLVSGEKAAKVLEREALKADVQKFMSSLRAVMAADLDVSALVEKKLATGAVKVDLKGHFRSPLVATTKLDKTLAITHEMAIPQDNHQTSTNK
jgi:hypothetical protein